MGLLKVALWFSVGCVLRAALAGVGLWQFEDPEIPANVVIPYEAFNEAEPSLRGPAGHGPSRTRAGSDADATSALKPLPPPPTDSDEGAWSLDVSEWQALYDVYSKHGRDDMFRSAFDAIQVRPLGVLPEPHRSHPNAKWLTESIESVSRRTGKLNHQAPSDLYRGDFCFVAFRVGARLEVQVGAQGRGLNVSSRLLAKGMLSAFVERKEQITPGLLSAAVVLVDSWKKEHELLTRDLWAATDNSALDGRFVQERVAGAYYAGDGDVVVLREGDDPNLDDLVSRLEALESSLAADVRGILR